MNNKTFLIVVVILSMVTVIGLISYLPTRFDVSSRIKVADFPMQIGGWTAKDIPLSERDYEILETRNLIMREYKNKKGEAVYLYIIYSEDNRKVSHPPEVCYLGSGLTIVDKSIIQLTNAIRATKMLAEQANSRQLVVYWFKAGKLYTEKYLKQQLKIVSDRMLGKRTSGAMIRLSGDIKNNDETAALKTLQLFASQIEPLLPKYVP